MRLSFLSENFIIHKKKLEIYKMTLFLDDVVAMIEMRLDKTESYSN